MTKFDEVTQRFGDVRYMNDRQAAFMREFVTTRDLRDLLEIGFYQGKSSAYFGAILEDRGGPGHLTTIDRLGAKEKDPNIEQLLDALGLAARVTPVYAERSYTWELGRMVTEGRREVFDFCFFDGGHTWDQTGFGFVLVDMLLKPGGWIIFDDLDWTVAGSSGISDPSFAKFSEDERQAKTVRMVFEQLAPYVGYDSLAEEPTFRWGIGRKAGRSADATHAAVTDATHETHAAGADRLRRLRDVLPFK